MKAGFRQIPPDAKLSDAEKLILWLGKYEGSVKVESDPLPDVPNTIVVRAIVRDQWVVFAAKYSDADSYPAAVSSILSQATAAAPWYTESAK